MAGQRSGASTEVLGTYWNSFAAAAACLAAVAVAVVGALLWRRRQVATAKALPLSRSPPRKCVGAGVGAGAGGAAACPDSPRRAESPRKKADVENPLRHAKKGAAA